MRLQNISIKSIPGLFRSHYTALFWLLLLSLFILEGWTVRGSVQQMLNATETTAEIRQASSVRVNFKEYEKIVERMNKAKGFQPSSIIARDPFIVEKTESIEAAPAQ